MLTAVRVGYKQKKINISIPKLDDFIHKVYINSCRKVYSNVYLFELNTQPLQVQKNNRELELIIQDCILNTIRESIPVESILRAYLDETMEEHVEEEIIEKEVKQVTKSNARTRKRAKTEVESIPSIPASDIKLSGIDDPIENELKLLNGNVFNSIEKVDKVDKIEKVEPVKIDIPEISIGGDKPVISFTNVDQIKEIENISENSDDGKIKILDTVPLDSEIKLNFEPIDLNASSSSSIKDNLLGEITVL